MGKTLFAAVAHEANRVTSAVPSPPTLRSQPARIERLERMAHKLNRSYASHGLYQSRSHFCWCFIKAAVAHSLWFSRPSRRMLQLVRLLGCQPPVDW